MWLVAAFWLFRLFVDPIFCSTTKYAVAYHHKAIKTCTRLCRTGKITKKKQKGDPGEENSRVGTRTQDLLIMSLVL